jgi:hypothetical protein
MIDLLLASTLYVAPLPAMDRAQQVRIVNVSAARQARELPREWEAFTLCISKRESGYGRTADTSKSYRAKNPASTASGRYQFLDSSWRRGGAWNVYKRLIRHGYTKETAAKVRNRLMATPIRQWKPVYQDILYAEVILSSEGNGWRHWHLAGSPCNSKVPA